MVKRIKEKKENQTQLIKTQINENNNKNMKFQIDMKLNIQVNESKYNNF